MALRYRSNACDDGSFSSPKECRRLLLSHKAERSEASSMAAAISHAKCRISGTAWGATKTPSPGEEGIDACIYKKRHPKLDVFFIKSSDDLLSHNVAGKRVKHQACLSVLQRAGATSWNNYMQCTSCLQYNELQGLPSQGGIIEKRNPELSSRVSK